MIVQPRFAAIKGIRPHEWILRFAFGGGICVIAGWIAKHYGPAIGGLFLAFPAIFPASATLIEAHERMHKRRAGFDGNHRGRIVAGIDAYGTMLGCVGLAGFALLCWLLLPRLASPAVFVLATVTWFLLSAALWWLAKTRLFRSRKSRQHHLQAFRSS
ncbi:MAG: hypothetical protein ACLGSD_13150 [Acidobacteriota bacterium]